MTAFYVFRAVFFASVFYLLLLFILLFINNLVKFHMNEYYPAS